MDAPDQWKSPRSDAAHVMKRIITVYAWEFLCMLMLGTEYSVIRHVT
jgi:hypothetical protein